MPLAANRRRQWLLALVSCLIAVLGAGGFVGWRDLAASTERREALNVARQGEFARAEPLLKRVAERSPRDPAVLRELSLGYLKARQFSEAELYFQRWCQASPQDPEPWTERVRLWVQWNRLPAAIEDARHVLGLQPDNRTLARQLPRWLMITGRFEEAEQESSRLLAVWPGDPWLLYVQALLYQRRGRADAAVALVDQLIEQYSDDFPEALFLRGTLYLDANQPALAARLLERAANLPGPHRREALYELSLALARQGKQQEAERIMAQARLLQEQDFLQQMLAEGERWDRENVQIRLAEQLFQSGQSRQAADVLSRVLSQNPNSRAARQLLARYSPASHP
jgi:tetratricopeptide (TPR) repeat protein